MENTFIDQCDELSVHTAYEFPLTSPLGAPPPAVAFYLDDVEVRAVVDNSDPNAYCFKFELFSKAYLHIDLSAEGPDRVATLTGRGPSNLEWSLVAQMRVRVGTESELLVVDRDVFEVGKYAKPIKFRIQDTAITRVRFDMRSINQFCRYHPSFDDGDVTIQCVDGTTLRTWKALLAYASPYMEEKLRDAAPEDVVDISPFTREFFTELLLHLYPTGRPIWANFKVLAAAAVAFDVRDVIARLSDHIFGYKKIPFTRRLADAVSLRLYPAITQLVDEAVRTGLWQHLIHNGFDPEQAVGPEIYKNVICPAIMEAMVVGSRPPVFNSHLQPESFLQPGDAETTACIMLLGTPFYINKGVLQVHGGNFTYDSDGNLVARLGTRMRYWCVQTNSSPGEVMAAVFLSMHPYGTAVPPELLRPAIAFAFDHELTYVLEDLEQLILREPTTTVEQCLQHLQLTDDFLLSELRRACLLRVEGSCKDLYKQVVLRAEFESLSPQLQEAVKGRMVTGWAFSHRRFAFREPTEFVDRVLKANTGGPPAPDSNPETFRSINSDAIFEQPHEGTQVAV